MYRARDTRLQREVAIKILSPTLAADPAWRARFDREARAISALNHPHICTLFDVGHQDGIDYLVLEHLEGETVAAHVARSGRLKPGAALLVAIGVGSALDAAHRSGIVHRDLTPANVMLTKAGAKLLDFGLAKAAPPGHTPGSVELPAAPSHTIEVSTVLGTLQYLTPEQIDGREADARSDIHALGALLFEMLTGRPPYKAETRADLLSAIVNDVPPSVSQLQPTVPPALDRVISTCLAKDPDERYQSARDLVRDLKWAASELGNGAEPTGKVRPFGSMRRAGIVAGVALGAVVASAVALRWPGERTTAAQPVQFTIALPANASFGGPGFGGTGSATQVAVSPDGRTLAFVAATESTYRIWLRPIGALAATPVAETEGAAYPFWSPDSRWIAFFAGGKLKKVQVPGGPPIVVCEAPSGRGGSWSRDNVLVFTPSGSGTGLMRVSSAGGTPVPVTTLDPATAEDSHRWPHFLPDGRHFFYTAVSGVCCQHPSQVRIGSLDSGDADLTLLQAESAATYASGYLLFARDRTLLAQPFDADTRKLTGDAVPVTQHVSVEGSRYVGASASANGTLVFGADGSAASSLTWFDRAGRMLGTLGEPGAYFDVALSPDERRVAVTLQAGSPANVDIWLFDLVRHVRSRQTFDPGVDSSPVWSPDGTHIAFERRQPARTTLRQTAVDQAAADEVLLEAPANVTNLAPSNWLSNGRVIAYTLIGARPLRADIWVLPLAGDRRPSPLMQTEHVETSGAFSPDRRWIALTTTESGRANVYVQSFPKAQKRYQISTDGGSHPVWRADGKELFYLGNDTTVMAVPMNTAWAPGTPTMLFSADVRTSPAGGQAYAVTKDGHRFLVNTRVRDASSGSVTVVVNWTGGLSRR